jgi:hypothetical protein
MSWISQDYWCAGWLSGLEYTLWGHAIIFGDQQKKTSPGSSGVESEACARNLD